MNRPKLEDFIYCNSIIDDEKYEKALEKYCDELEKALDKACDVLNEINACCKPETDVMRDCGVDCKKCWKEYLLDD